MKFILTFLLIICFQPLIHSGLQDEVTEQIKLSIQSGDASALAEYFNSSIDIVLPGTDKTFSKNQATQVIKDFFTKYPPKSFCIDHMGTSNDGSIYIIGTYNSTSATFSTYLLLKKSSGNLLIFQLQFEKE